MKRISFMLTPRQLLDGSKDVTRRLGWKTLKPGDRLLAVSKCMGLKPGEKAEVYGPIEVISVRREPLWQCDSHEARREGFPEMSWGQFVEFFCRTHKGCTPETEVTRIEFRFGGTKGPQCNE